MPPTDIERIAVLENQSKTYKETLKDIDNKLDLLPKAISLEIEKAIERCREMQSVKCGLAQKRVQVQQPIHGNEGKVKTGVAGWVASGLIGISWAARALGWW